MWPQQIEELLQNYYRIQRNSGDILTAQEKGDLVKALIAAYDALSPAEKGDVLVPASGEFLKDCAIKAEKMADGKYRFDINYKWPPNDGFVGVPQRIALTTESEYDRIGSCKGKFLSPISRSGKPEQYLSRALPYYIPEPNIADSPAYHRYRIKSQYGGDTSSGDGIVLQGIIAQAFWRCPDDGGGVQVKLPVYINRLGGVFDEVPAQEQKVPLRN